MSKVQTDKNGKVIGVIAQVDKEIQSLPIKVKCDQIPQKHHMHTMATNDFHYQWVAPSLN